MTEKEGYKVIPLPEEQDPMFQKRMNIYSEVSLEIAFIC